MVLGDLNFDIDSAALLPEGKYSANDMMHTYYVNMHNAYNSPTAIRVPAKMTVRLYT